MPHTHTHYLAVLRKEPDSDWGVDFPDVPGCVTADSTVAEAIEMATEALQAHIDLLYEKGWEVPEPRPVEEIEIEPADPNETVTTTLVATAPPSKTVRVNISINDRVLEELDIKAKARGTTRSGLIAQLVEGLEHRA